MNRILAVVGEGEGMEELSGSWRSRRRSKARLGAGREGGTMVAVAGVQTYRRSNS